MLWSIHPGERLPSPSSAVRNLTYPAPLSHWCGLILQICPLQHPQDLVFPHRGRKATPGPSAGHLLPGLLQLLLAGLPASATKPQTYPSFPMGPPLHLGLHCLPVTAHIRFKTMVLAFKAINRTAPVYLQTLVRPHAPAWALTLHQRAGWFRHHWEQTKPTQQSCDSSLLWHLSGGINSRPMSGQQSHSPYSLLKMYVL